MYPSSSSSSYQGSMGPNGGGGLTRYGSAPSKLLRTTVDSLIAPPHRDLLPTYGSTNNTSTQHLVATANNYLLPPETSSSLTSESVCMAGGSSRPSTVNNNFKEQQQRLGGVGRLQRSSHGSNDMTVLQGEFNSAGGHAGSAAASSSSSLVRHSSSPAGFLNQLAAAAAADNGFSISRGFESYNSKMASDHSSCGITRLNSQLSFTQKDSLSQISEENHDGTNVIDDRGIITNNRHAKSAHNSYESRSFGTGSWDDTNTIVFSTSSNKRSNNVCSSAVSGLNASESQFQFSLPQTTLEMATMEGFMNIPEDSVPCKIRAKRGCATHPRSIAERERRTRISGRLKKLQDLVPNMDKQTSYADMLDFAVEHIKGLQEQVEKLEKELENCRCGCKNGTHT